MTDITSLTKFVGSKVALLASSPHLLPTPDHGGKALVPFLGGGSVAAHYAARGHRVIASDINARLVNAHVEVQYNVDAVISALSKIQDDFRDAIVGTEGEEDTLGRGYFEWVRGNLDEGSDRLQAARFLFVVRAGFNGLWRENEAGQCTTAYGKVGPNRDLVQVDKLRAYSAAIRGVEFHHEDFAVTCARARVGDVASLDPPYQGTFTDYAGGDWDASNATLPGLGRVSERERLAAMLVYLDSIGARFSVNDSDCATTRCLYGRWGFESVSRSGQMNSNGDDRGSVNEGLWRNWR